jgi:hypothetical protein
MFSPTAASTYHVALYADGQCSAATILEPVYQVMVEWVDAPESIHTDDTPM